MLFSCQVLLYVTSIFFIFLVFLYPSNTFTCILSDFDDILIKDFFFFFLRFLTSRIELLEH